jgi:ubiquinone/menaquinone biosynthesis C-methylase UbiE
MLARACAKVPEGAWLQASAVRLPLADRSVDWVVSCNSFHYFRDPAACLAEAGRVLRPGGRLVVVDWCDDYLSCRLCSAWLRWTNAAFYRTYRVRDCRRLVERAAFEVTSERRFRVGWPWGLLTVVAERTSRPDHPGAG